MNTQTISTMAGLLTIPVGATVRIPGRKTTVEVKYLDDSEYCVRLGVTAGRQYGRNKKGAGGCVCIWKRDGSMTYQATLLTPSRNIDCIEVVA